MISRQVHIHAELLEEKFKHFQMKNSSWEGLSRHTTGIKFILLILRLIPIYRITGLDPAGPNFFPPVYENPLSPQDGDFVDTIQSDNFFIGTSVSLGHVSFYPNNGTVQPGCAPLRLNSFFDFITGEK